MLVSCNSVPSNSNAGSNKGKVDCYSIEVKSGGSNVFRANYQSLSSSVYEYKSNDGSAIYLNNRLTYSYINGSGEVVNADMVVRGYPSRYKSEFITYHYSRLVGYLTNEKNYILDLGARTIDCENKWSEYLYDKNPDTTVDSISNPEAYRCAKRAYYVVNSYGSSEFYEIKLDLVESGLDRHSYIQLGDDCVITYVTKWF